jgi:hypothetical protein
MPKGYDFWHAAATRVINEWLARGRGLEIVRLKPDEFLSWPDAQGLPNTAASRLKYVEERASGAQGPSPNGTPEGQPNLPPSVH